MCDTPRSRVGDALLPAVMKVRAEGGEVLSWHEGDPAPTGELIVTGEGSETTMVVAKALARAARGGQAVSIRYPFDLVFVYGRPLSESISDPPSY